MTWSRIWGGRVWRDGVGNTVMVMTRRGFDNRANTDSVTNGAGLRSTTISAQFATNVIYLSVKNREDRKE